MTTTDARAVVLDPHQQLLDRKWARHVDQMTRAHVDIVVGKMADKPGSGHHFAETHPNPDSVRDGPGLDRPRSNRLARDNDLAMRYVIAWLAQ
jgi:hypothetical protein